MYFDPAYFVLETEILNFFDITFEEFTLRLAKLLFLVMTLFLFIGNIYADTSEQELTAFQQSLLDKLATEGTVTPEEKALLHEWNMLGPSSPRSPGRDGKGGPDGFGYRWVDSDEEGSAVEYNWIEINEIGTPVQCGDLYRLQYSCRC